jgi:hypothetical protein
MQRARVLHERVLLLGREWGRGREEHGVGSRWGTVGSEECGLARYPSSFYMCSLNRGTGNSATPSPMLHMQ